MAVPTITEQQALEPESNSEASSQLELNRLKFYLRKSDGINNVSQLDGFLTAIACTYDFVLPGEYIPAVLGTNELNTEELQEFAILTYKHINSIISYLDSDELNPIILVGKEGNEYMDDWILGFYSGMSIKAALWQKLVDDPVYNIFLMPVMLFSGKVGNTENYRQLFGKEVSADYTKNMIFSGIMEIYRYFRDNHSVFANGFSQKIVTKTGRNEPCPCGSGKKYKRCCSD